MKLRRSRRHGGHPRYTAILASLALAAGLTAWAPPALAQEPLPEDNAGTGQYVEPVPDAEGDRRAAPGAGGGGSRGGPAPGSGGGSGGAEQRILDRIASDPGSGAPSGSGGSDDSGSSGGSGDDRVKTAEVSPEDDDGPVSALTSAAFDSETPAVAIILLAVLAMALVGVVIRSRRSS